MPKKYTARADLALAGPRVCCECRQEFPAMREDQVFCSTECRTLDKNRAMLRGRMLYRMAYHWIRSGGRSKKGGSMIGDVSRLVREWIAEDKLAGRNPPPPANMNR